MDGFDFSQLPVRLYSDAVKNTLYTREFTADATDLPSQSAHTLTILANNNAAVLLRAMHYCRDAYPSPVFWERVKICSHQRTRPRCLELVAELLVKARKAFLHDSKECPTETARLVDEWIALVDMAGATGRPIDAPGSLRWGPRYKLWTEWRKSGALQGVGFVPPSRDNEIMSTPRQPLPPGSDAGQSSHQHIASRSSSPALSIKQEEQDDKAALGTRPGGNRAKPANTTIKSKKRKRANSLQRRRTKRRERGPSNEVPNLAPTTIDNLAIPNEDAFITQAELHKHLTRIDDRLSALEQQVYDNKQHQRTALDQLFGRIVWLENELAAHRQACQAGRATLETRVGEQAGRLGRQERAVVSARDELADVQNTLARMWNADDGYGVNSQHNWESHGADDDHRGRSRARSRSASASRGARRGPQNRGWGAC